MDVSKSLEINGIGRGSNWHFHHSLVSILVTALPLLLLAYDKAIAVEQASFVGESGNSPSAGSRVTVIKWEAIVNFDDDVKGTLKLGHNVEITKVEGNRLWIRCSGGGWINKADAVDYEDAISYFTGMISRDRSPKNYAHRGMVWMNRGALDDALSDLNVAIKKDPTERAWYTVRGIVWETKGYLDKSIADYDEAIRLDSEYPAAYFNRGNAWTSKGDYAKAIADYVTTIKLDPKHGVCIHQSCKCTVFHRKLRQGETGL